MVEADLHRSEKFICNFFAEVYLRVSDLFTYTRPVRYPVRQIFCECQRVLRMQVTYGNL